MKKIIGVVVLVGAMALGACDSLNRAMTSHTNLVARADGHELTIDETAEFLSKNPRLPVRREVVDAVANLWIDYTLLAAAAHQDSLLESVDLESVVQPRIEQELVWRLRENVIQVDTSVTDEELRALYQENQPGLEVRARHILLRVPSNASAEQRDSIESRAAELQQRAAAGSDFAALAREHSEDPGSADSGGDLGFFSRGDMLQSFEQAAFALDVGGVSDVVQSPVGYHIIKLEERRLPEFEEVKESFRSDLVTQREQNAEQSYIDEVVEPREITVDDGAFDVARELAEKPNTQLSGRAADRTLVTYRDGSVTAAEYLDQMRRFAPSQRSQYASATDSQIESVLEGMARNEILVAEAREQVEPLTQEERDSLAANARRQLQMAVARTGLGSVEPQGDETETDAIARSVTTFMESVLRGEQNILPLGPLAYALRSQFDVQLYERTFSDVIDRAQALRPTAGDSAAGPSDTATAGS